MARDVVAAFCTAADEGTTCGRLGYSRRDGGHWPRELVVGGGVC